MTKTYFLKATIEETRLFEVDANSPSEAEGILEDMLEARVNFNDVTIYDDGELENVEIVDVKVQGSQAEED